MRRIAIAIGIAAAIYGLALGAGSLLYATGAIATGATHNDCADFKHVIAQEHGISDEDVPQSEIKQRTQSCLDGHTLSKGEAFRSEYLLWSAWPAAISALVFLGWPRWAGLLKRQEQADLAAEAANLAAGGSEWRA
jgi:hypothetical protein